MTIPWFLCVYWFCRMFSLCVSDDKKVFSVCYKEPVDNRFIKHCNAYRRICIDLWVRFWYCFVCIEYLYMN
jgi:hypothetical protein